MLLKVSDVDVSVIYNAPPLPPLAVLSINVTFSNKLFADVWQKRTAPPLLIAVLLMKFKFVNLLSDKSLIILIAPPKLSLFPFLKVILSKIIPLVTWLISKILIPYLPIASIVYPLPLMVIGFLIFIA